MGTVDNKRLAKNTVMLYFRMVLLILVNLYTSRVVLNVLGVEDFGLYSIVGGVVVFLGFINISMATASQRFLAYAIGKGDEKQTESMFSSVFFAQFLIAFLILFIGETIGLIYIESFLNVESNRIFAAHIVFQFSLFSFVAKTLTVPYNASIIANEKMSVFALISILEAMMQLTIIISLKYFAVHDKLILYAFLLFLSVVITQSIYYIYCKINFKECHFRRNWDKKTIYEIYTYSGWNLLGAFSAVVIDQGCNMVLNGFFGVVVNAARGIAFQVSAGISALSSNFQQAMNPQIVKSYADNDLESMHKLIILGTRFSFYLLLVLALPIYYNIDFILDLWLGIVPEYSREFCKLVLINSLINAFSGCLMMGAMSTGNIKKYQIVVATINLLNLPLSTLCLFYWRNPYVSMYVMISLSVLAFVARLFITVQLIKLNIRWFVNNALFKSLTTTFFCVVLMSIIDFILPCEGLMCFCFRIMLSLLAILFVILFVGIYKTEKIYALDYFKDKI